MYKSPHHAFCTEYPGIVKELKTEAVVINPITNQEKKYIAVWDTGATNSVISPKVFSELNLVKIDEVLVHGVNSHETRPITGISIGLPNKVRVDECRVSVCDVAGCDLLIGMDIISIGDFAISNGDGKTTFSFAFPPFENKTDLLDKANNVNRRNQKHFPPGVSITTN